jgi:phosphatidylinositol alpha-1,6-mannosyltransferase
MGFVCSQQVFKIMRILFLATDIQKIGGISRFNQGFLDALINAGIETAVVSMNDMPVRHERMTVSSLGWIKNRFLRQAVFVLSVLKQAFLFVPDRIVCGHINFSPLCCAMKFLLGKKYVVIVHGIEAYQGVTPGKTWAVNRAEAVVVVSNFTKEKLIATTHVSPDKVFILPNSINAQKFEIKGRSADLVQRYGVKEAKVVLTVARMSKGEQYKGYDNVLGSLPQVIESIPNLKYLIVGEGDDLPRVKLLVQQLNLEDHVVFCGRLADHELADHYNLCDVFIMPSRNEGFGIVFLEALACGKPVIAGNRDGSRDALLNGEFGLLVDPDSFKDIAAALTQVLTGQARKDFFDRERLRRRVIETYGVVEFRKKLMGILEQV